MRCSESCVSHLNNFSLTAWFNNAVLVEFLVGLQEQQSFNACQKEHGNQIRFHKFARARARPQYRRTARARLQHRRTARARLQYRRTARARLQHRRMAIARPQYRGTARARPQYRRTGCCCWCCFFVTVSCPKPKDRG